MELKWLCAVKWEAGSMQAIHILTSYETVTFRNTCSVCMSALLFPLSFNQEIRLSLYLIKHHDVQAHGGGKVYFHAF
jgi:hypothetical protein